MGQPAEGPTGKSQAFPAPLPAQRTRSAIGAMLLAFGVTLLTCMLSGALKSMADQIAAIWLANAVLLAQMMVAPRSKRYWVLAGGIAGNVAANLFSQDLEVSLSYTAADIVEVLVAFSFAPRIATAVELIRPNALLRFLAGSVVLAPLVSGLLAAALLRGQLSGHMLPNFANWFCSDALSLAIFTPAAIVFWTGEVTRVLRRDRRWKAACLLLLVCAVTTGVFGQTRYPLLYWALPPIVLLAFQADLAGVMFGLLLCLAIAVWFTMRGLGPMWMYPYPDMEARIFALQLFLFAALGIALPISASQVLRARLVGLLREGERRYRILAENATDIVMSVTLDGRLTYVSPRAQTVMRRDPEELVGACLPRSGRGRRSRCACYRHRKAGAGRKRGLAGEPLSASRRTDSMAGNVPSARHRSVFRATRNAYCNHGNHPRHHGTQSRGTAACRRAYRASGTSVS